MDCVRADLIPIILIVGVSGSGKSTIANFFAKDKVFEESETTSDAQSYTKSFKIQTVISSGKKYVLIDT